MVIEMGTGSVVNNTANNNVHNEKDPESQPQPLKKTEAETEVVKKTSATAFQEINGMSNLLRKSLLARSLGITDQETGKENPNPTAPPTFPNAPLFADRVRTDAEGKPLTDSGGNPLTEDGNAIHPNDVQQRGLGDCYFVASVAALARSNPEAIRNMITENRDDQGNVTSYTVRLHQKDGGFLGTGLFSGYEEVRVEVLPSELLPNGSAPADNGEVWVNVLEAAYAKHIGSVADLGDGGNAADALSTLTGRDTESFAPGGDYSFSDLQADLNGGKNIVLDTKSDADDPKKKVPGSPYGLVTSHSYMVERVYTDADGRQLVQLRNPWGYDHPKPIPFEELGRYFSDFNVN
jgi:hypothetical protein